VARTVTVPRTGLPPCSPSPGCWIVISLVQTGLRAKTTSAMALPGPLSQPWAGMDPQLAAALPGQQQPNVDSLLGPMQGMSLGDPAQAQNNLAAMMWWQMQMQQQLAAAPGGHQAAAAAAAMGGMGGRMMPPWGMPGMAMAPPTQPPTLLSVRVEGLKFEYQMTEDDVRKVFSRYGEVSAVNMDREGTSSTVQFSQADKAVAAQRDLDQKQLAGMSGAFLRVEFAATQPQSFDPAFAQMAAAAVAAQSMPGMPGAFPGYPAAPGMPGGAPMMQSQFPSGQGMPPGAGRPKKHTCRLEVGIENEGEFRVGSRVIAIARQIWQDPSFQEHGGKTRLRGRGIGGPHEADEPLALCISCPQEACFERAVQQAEGLLRKVHEDYKAFCAQHGRALPELSMKVSKKSADVPGPTHNHGMGGSGPGSNADPPKGERPDGAPSEAEILEFIEERNESRKAGNFKRADEVREQLRQAGVVLMDEKNAKGNLKGNQVTNWRYWRP